jgi:hypothetical protein
MTGKHLNEPEVLELVRASPEAQQLLEMGVSLITSKQKAELEHAANRLALVRRYITEPELSGDASLRANIANVMGWPLPASYWQSGERALILAERMSQAQARAHARMNGQWQDNGQLWHNTQAARMNAQPQPQHTAKDQVEMCEDELRALPPWTCHAMGLKECGQRNSGWATECGRCGAKR